MNLAFYSDQVIAENAKVDARLRGLLPGKGCRIAYVPSGPEPDLRFYRQKQAYYAAMGLKIDLFFDLDQPLDDCRMPALFACNAIHLPGGDTLDFLRRLRTSGLADPLADWARRGGVLIGTSAGAILMTPTVALDALFSGGDPRDVVDGAALNLVPFEFFPHLDADPAYLSRLLDYSRTVPRMIAACPDGDGVVVRDGAIESIGRIVWISDGAIVAAPCRV